MTYKLSRRNIKPVIDPETYTPPKPGHDPEHLPFISYSHHGIFFLMLSYVTFFRFKTDPFEEVSILRFRMYFISHVHKTHRHTVFSPLSLSWIRICISRVSIASLQKRLPKTVDRARCHQVLCGFQPPDNRYFTPHFEFFLLTKDTCHSISLPVF